MLGLLSPSDIMKIGLEFFRFQAGNKSQEHSVHVFRKFYGSLPLDLADMWYDLTTTDIPEAKVDKKEISMKGLRMFFAAHHFLWTYPKNAQLLASKFGICERYSRGDPLWKWIKKIQALKTKKIVWHEGLNSPNTEIFCVTVDGVDFRMWEKKHPEYPVDSKYYSKKYKHCGAKYELAVSVFHPKIVWMNGPFRGGKHDLEVFREDGLKAKIPQGKIAIADRGYRTDRTDEQEMLALPNDLDDKELKNFKSRARMRHESVNGRIKFFECLSNTF